MGNVMFANRMPYMLKAYRDQCVAEEMARLRSGKVEDLVLASYAPHQLVDHIEEVFDVTQLTKVVNPDPVKETDNIKWRQIDTAEEDVDRIGLELHEMLRMPSSLTGFFVHPRYIFNSFKELRDTLSTVSCSQDALFFYFMGRSVWTFPDMLLPNAPYQPITVQLFAYRKTYPVLVITQGTQGINTFHDLFPAHLKKAADMEFDGVYHQLLKDWLDDKWQLGTYDTLQWSNM